MNDFQFGDYPYNNEILEMPNRALIGGLDIHICPERYFSKEFLYSIDDNIEKWKNPDLSELFWFRWITGHQIMLVFWHVLSKKLLAVINTSNLSEIDQNLNMCINLLEGCSVIFEYTGSCSEQFYHSTIRPYMALFHRGFSGKWSVDYEPIPELVNVILKTNYPASLKNTQKQFKESFFKHQKSHYGVAKKLVPSSASLLKKSKNAELEIKTNEEHNVLFDYFFLVKRGINPNTSLLYSLSKRIKAVIIDLTLNGFYVSSDSESSQLEVPEQGSSKHQENLKSVLFESANTAIMALSGFQKFMKANYNQVGETVLVEAVKRAKQEFGSRLIACYALGSLAHGGFSPQVSDVDFAIILTSPLTSGDDHKIEVIKNYIKSLQISLAERLSIFWGSLASLKKEEAGGRFPPLDRLDLIKYGRLLAGNDVRTSIPKPTREEIEVSGAIFALNFLGTPEINREFLQPTQLFDKGVVHLTKVVLFPVRFLYTASTGNIGRNDVAVAHYLENNKGNKAELVKQAFRWRCEPPVYNEDTIKLIEQALIPLYLQFIDTYYSKMLDYEEINLSEDLKQWRDKLSLIKLATE